MKVSFDLVRKFETVFTEIVSIKIFGLVFHAAVKLYRLTGIHSKMKNKITVRSNRKAE